MENEFNFALKRYLAIQDKEKALAQEKIELRNIIDKYLQSMNRTQIIVNTETLNIHISKKEKIQIKYNESILQERLQERYNSILSLDLKKVKKHKDELEKELGENAFMFASPDRTKIKTMVESGKINSKEFEGTFEKEVKNIIYIRRKLKNTTSSSDAPF